MPASAAAAHLASSWLLLHQMGQDEQDQDDGGGDAFRNNELFTCSSSIGAVVYREKQPTAAAVGMPAAKEREREGFQSILRSIFLRAAGGDTALYYDVAAGAIGATLRLCTLTQNTTNERTLPSYSHSAAAAAAILWCHTDNKVKATFTHSISGNGQDDAIKSHAE